MYIPKSFEPSLPNGPQHSCQRVVVAAVAKFAVSEGAIDSFTNYDQLGCFKSVLLTRAVDAVVTNQDYISYGVTKCINPP